MQTASILTLAEAAELLGIKSIEIVRGVARGSLKAFRVGNGPERFTIENLQSWLTSNRDTPMPALLDGWFDSRELYAAENSVLASVNKRLGDNEIYNLIDASQLRSEYARTRVTTISLPALEVSVPELQSKPSDTKGISMKFPASLDRFKNVLNTYYVAKMRERTLGFLQTKGGEFGSGSMLERLYTEFYSKLVPTAQGVLNASVTHREFSYKLQTTDGEKSLRLQFAVKITPSQQPHTSDLIRLAF